jgi:ABC-2 type transport system ATP-binding protein
VSVDPSTPLLAARGLVRRYRGVVALDGIDLRLAAGEAVALLGANGAGKTTLLEVLAGIRRPDEGTLVWSHPAGSKAPPVGWVPQRPSLYARLTTRENLRLFAALERRSTPQVVADELLEKADLVAVADRPAAQLSTGTRQRLNLAIALAGEPAALLLDEPSATLSPDQRHRLWTWLAELRRDGMALVFSTQSVDEAGRQADRTLVLARGRCVFAGTVAELIARHPGDPAAAGDPGERAFLTLIDDPTPAMP